MIVVPQHIPPAAKRVVIGGPGLRRGGEGPPDARIDGSVHRQGRIVRLALLVFSAQDRFQSFGVRGSDQLECRIVRITDLDRSRARDWCFVEAMLNACWSLEDNDGRFDRKLAGAELVLSL